jgi:DNA-binding MarR family transcriptional regulator
MADRQDITTVRGAAYDPRLVAFGRFLGTANRLEHLLGAAIEEEFGISHLMFEVLIILGRVHPDGLTMGSIAQEQVLTTGGVTRLIDRMEQGGLVVRGADPHDRRVQLVRLTETGEQTAIRATRMHIANIERYFLDVVPEERRDDFVDCVRALSKAAAAALPRRR